jgi:hypothetical protein
VDYPADGTVKVVTQTKTQGFTLKATLNRSLKKEKSGIKETVSAAFEPKFEWRKQNMEFSGKLTSLSDYSGGVIAKDLLGPSSKVELTLNQSDRDGLSTIGLASYKTAKLALKGRISYPFSIKKQPVKINAEIVGKLQDFNVGAGVTVNLEGDVARINTEGVLAYDVHDSQYKTRLGYDIFDGSLLCGLSFFQKFSSKTNWGLDITSEENFSKTSFIVGVEQKLDDFTVLKGKWLLRQTEKTDWRFGVSLKQKVSPYVTATLGADLNPRAFLGSTDGDPHTFGLEIKILE